METDESRILGLWKAPYGNFTCITEKKIYRLNLSKDTQRSFEYEILPDLPYYHRFVEEPQPGEVIIAGNPEEYLPDLYLYKATEKFLSARDDSIGGWTTIYEWAGYCDDENFWIKGGGQHKITKEDRPGFYRF